jgi:response regulator RpfG family c-di-GMP phosphodiesterase
MERDLSVYRARWGRLVPSKVLLVDDEPNVLASYKRHLRKGYDVDVALGGEEALKKTADSGPYAVVVSDMRMPGMDGIQFLSRVRIEAPETVRMMLTGCTETEIAINAVNEGKIFRFLTKPIPPDVLSRALSEGVEQYRLIRAEQELLENTLRGSIKVLIDVLSLVNPTAFGRGSRVRRLVRRMYEELKGDKPWEMEIATMLSQVGCVTVPEETLAKIFQGGSVTEQERQMFAAHAQVGSALIANIPRLESAAEIIRYQEKRFDGSGLPTDDVKGELIPLGARVLKAALDLDALTASGAESAAALMTLKSRNRWYDPAVIGALERVLITQIKYDIRSVRTESLTSSMILAENVMTRAGTLVIAKGQEVTPWVKIRLKNFSKNVGIREPFKVLIPIEKKGGPSGSPGSPSDNDQ